MNLRSYQYTNLPIYQSTTLLFRQLSGDAFGPPLHAVLARQTLRAGRELIEVGLHHLLAGRHDLLPWLSLIGPAKTSKRVNSPVSILARVSLTIWMSSAGRSAAPLVGCWPSMKPNRPRPPQSESK